MALFGSEPIDIQTWHLINIPIFYFSFTKIALEIFFTCHVSDVRMFLSEEGLLRIYISIILIWIFGNGGRGLGRSGDSKIS
jgi:uncharacterized membrane-anchored protein YitT (DUF2179 family)